MNKRFIYAFMAMMCFVSADVEASSNPINITNIRMKSMGGTGVATSTDEMALLNNPAGLASAKFRFKMPRIGYAMNQDAYDKLSDLQTISSGDGSEADQTKLLQDLAPFNLSMQQNVAPGLSLTFKGFGAGVFGQSNINGELYQTPLDVVLNLEGYGDLVPALGFAQKFDVFGKETAMGISAKFISRYRLYDKVTGSNQLHYNLEEILSFVNDQDDKKEPGIAKLSGVGFDFGFLRPIESARFGTGRWGVAVHDIGASLSGDKEIVSGNVTTKKAVTEQIPLTATIGFGVENAMIRELLHLGPRMIGKTTLSADYQFVSSYQDFKKNIHLGIEQKVLFNAVKLRGGINQGFVVGGVGLDLPFLIHVDYAVYAEELGNKIGDNSMKYQVLQFGVLF